MQRSGGEAFEYTGKASQASARNCKIAAIGQMSAAIAPGCGQLDWQRHLRSFAS